MKKCDSKAMEPYEERMKAALDQAAWEAAPSESQKLCMRSEIHGQIQKRSRTMKKMNGKKMVLAAAAMAILAAGTAIGSGTIASLYSGTNVNQVDFPTAESVRKTQILGGKAKAVQSFADGTDFLKGYFIQVSANDAQGNQVGQYPEISVQYEDDLVLSISAPLTGVTESDYPVVLADEFDEVDVTVKEMEYLFLPPDAEVSEEDRALQEAGKQEISYGSEKEERRLYRGASWEEDGLHYHLMTMRGDQTPKELMEKAKEIIAVE